MFIKFRFFTKLAALLLGILLFVVCCHPDGRHNSGDPLSKEYWENRLLENDIVAYPRSFLVEGFVTGLNQTSLTILSRTDGSAITVNGNGPFSLSVFASPKYLQLEFPTQPSNVHCIVWDRGDWDGFKLINVQISCPFAKSIVSGKTLLWDRCTYGSTWNPFGTSVGIGKGDCSIGSAEPLRFCTVAEGYNSTTNPNACNGGINTQLVSAGAVYQSCVSRSSSKSYQRDQWRLPLYTEMFSVIRCSDTNTGVITGEDGCITVGDATTYPGATADPILFPNAKAAHYWSAQTFAGLGDVQAYMVDFDGGKESYMNKDSLAYVRCVSDL
ncbi:PF07603 family protein [Leptospira wolbachii serovar Codice str. CDC]|uniref:PF07603 family protein n=1 Tax=Leptospira wolbachii serovar Codice str. CDC TaxID=1218599 RepID=R9A1C2_9LEPT|nr:PF07603 family protein [Leptospira wolbachii serovar Codice str. CDC]